MPIHEHPIFPSTRIFWDTCKGCCVEGFLYGGYTCNDSDCKVWFHKECAEAPSEINHSSHQQHPLLLTSDMGDGPCDLCGQKRLGSAGYCCSTCDFKVDLTCGIKPSPPVMEHPLCHDHPLVFLKKKGGGDTLRVMQGFYWWTIIFMSWVRRVLPRGLCPFLERGKSSLPL